MEFSLSNLGVDWMQKFKAKERNTKKNNEKQLQATFQVFTLAHFKWGTFYTICAKGAQCYLRTKSVLSFLGGADSIIQVGSDS